MPSATTEDYLKQIFLASTKATKAPVSMGAIATALNVSPGTATTMVKGLANSGYVLYRARVGATLTPKGREQALKTLRRHRILEVFLVEKLGLNWAEVHDEAELLEHTISDRVLEALDAFLNHPTSDPHGSPIPTASGEYAQPSYSNLSECTLGKLVRIERIAGDCPDFLLFLEAQGVQPGVKVRVEKRCDFAEAITLTVGKPTRTVMLGLSAGRKVLVSA